MDITINLIRGQIILLELEDESFTGTFHEMNAERTRLDVRNVRKLETLNEIEDQQYFYKSELKSLKMFEIKSQLEQIANRKESPFITEISFSEFIQMDEKARTAIFITQTDRAYHQAIKDMRSQSKIVVNLEGCWHGPFIRTAILTLATVNNCYIFDLISLGKIFTDLKDILESEIPRKITFDSRRVVSNLQAYYATNVNISFDCIFVHLSTGGDKQILKLQDFVRFYYNIPDKFLIDENVNWNRRPFAEKLKVLTARRTLFIFKLYHTLLHDRILKNFYSISSQLQ